MPIAITIVYLYSIWKRVRLLAMKNINDDIQPIQECNFARELDFNGQEHEWKQLSLDSGVHYIFFIYFS